MEHATLSPRNICLALSSTLYSYVLFQVVYLKFCHKIICHHDILQFCAYLNNITIEMVRSKIAACQFITPGNINITLNQ